MRSRCIGGMGSSVMAPRVRLIHLEAMGRTLIGTRPRLSQARPPRPHLIPMTSTKPARGRSSTARRAAPLPSCRYSHAGGGRQRDASGNIHMSRLVSQSGPSARLGQCPRWVGLGCSEQIRTSAPLQQRDCASDSSTLYPKLPAPAPSSPQLPVRRKILPDPQ
jgi:hypothetical protein